MLYWLVVWNMVFMTFHILGMSSSQLTILFRGVEKPPTSIYIYIYIYIYILYNMQKMQQIWISCGQRLMRLTMNPPENLMLDPDIRHM